MNSVLHSKASPQLLKMGLFDINAYVNKELEISDGDHKDVKEQDCEPECLLGNTEPGWGFEGIIPPFPRPLTFHKAKKSGTYFFTGDIAFHQFD